MAQQHFFIVCVLVFMFVVSASSETNSTTLQNGKEILILKMDIFMALYKICYTHTIKVCYEAETDAKKMCDTFEREYQCFIQEFKNAEVCRFLSWGIFLLEYIKEFVKISVGC